MNVMDKEAVRRRIREIAASLDLSDDEIRAALTCEMRESRLRFQYR